MNFSKELELEFNRTPRFKPGSRRVQLYPVEPGLNLGLNLDSVMPPTIDMMISSRLLRPVLVVLDSLSGASHWFCPIMVELSQTASG